MNIHEGDDIFPFSDDAAHASDDIVLQTYQWIARLFILLLYLYLLYGSCYVNKEVNMYAP